DEVGCKGYGFATENGKLALRSTDSIDVTTTMDGLGLSWIKLFAPCDFTEIPQLIDRILSRSTSEKAASMVLSLRFHTPVFESMIGVLNELDHNWEVILYGSYADGIDPFTADATASPDGRFPIFVWGPNDGGHVLYEADIVPTPQGRYLEIHTNS